MNALALLKLRWAALAARERNALVLAGVVVLAALVWSVLLGPALQTLREAPTKNQQIDLELEQMQLLQARAQTLQAEPTLAASVVEQLLQKNVLVLGKGASLQMQGDQATLTLLRVPAQNLAQWMADAHGEKLHPSVLHLQREGATADVRWSGTMVFQLPPAQLH